MSLLVNHFFNKNFGLYTSYKKSNLHVNLKKKFHQFSHFLENKVDRLLVKINFISKLSILSVFFKQGLIKVNNKIVTNSSYLLNVHDIVTVHILVLNIIHKCFNLRKNLFYRYNIIYRSYAKRNLNFKRLVFNSLHYNNLIVNYAYCSIICISNSYLRRIKSQLQLNEFNNYYLK